MIMVYGINRNINLTMDLQIGESQGDHDVPYHCFIMMLLGPGSGGNSKFSL